MTLREQIAADLEDGAVWFNMDEFGKWRDLNGEQVLCIFTKDKPGTVKLLTNAEDDNYGVSRATGVLWVRACDVEGVEVGSDLQLDGKLYVVTEAHLIQDYVWRLTLEVGDD